MRNILITGVGGDVACAILRCLFDNNTKDKIYGIDIKRYTPYMDRLKKTFVAPKYTESEYLSFIKRLICEYRITHFLPTSESEIIIANREREYFAEHNVKLLINNEDIIRICTSKYNTAHFLGELGCNAPATYYAEDYDYELEYPFVMKPDSGCGSKDLLIVPSEEEWCAAKKEGMICQQMVGSPETEYTVGVFSDGRVINSIIMRRQLGYGGLSTFVECCDIPEINVVVKKIAKALDLNGAINVQLRKDGNRYYVFEINPRLSSTAGFRHKFGFKDVLWWFDMVDGRIVEPYGEPPNGAIGVKVLDDVILNEHMLGGVFLQSKVKNYCYYIPTWRHLEVFVA